MKVTLTAGQYFGTLVRRRDDPRFTLTESVYAGGSEIPKHAHEHAYCGVLLDGFYTENFGGRVRECTRATVVFHPSGEEHTERFGANGGRLFRIEPKPTCLAQIRQCSNVLDRPATFQGGALAHLSMRLYREFRRNDALAPLAIEGLTLELLVESGRQARCTAKERLPAWLLRVRDQLHAAGTQSITLTTLAANAGVHPVHLVRTFRRHYRLTPAEYLRHLRVDRAGQLLLHTRLPLAEIALAVGFADQSHFTRIFRRITGVTPAVYRGGYDGRK